MLACFIIFCFSPRAHAQPVFEDSLRTRILGDSIKGSQTTNIYTALLDSNIFLRNKRVARALPVQLKKNGNGIFFYIMAGLLLFLGIMKTVYSRYFTTLFRVFFNTSLRQTQLTDQLEQHQRFYLHRYCVTVRKTGDLFLRQFSEINIHCCSAP